MNPRSLGALAAILLAGCAAPAPSPSPSPELGELASGDLLFLDLSCGELCDAIERVTLEQFGVSGPRLSHVGIVDVDPDRSRFLIEAWPPFVVRTPLATVLARVAGRGGHLWLPLRREARPFGARAVEEARRRIGVPYDDDFLLGNGKLYCSELVLEVYRDFRSQLVFALSPMVFGRPGSPERAIWERHYRGRGRPVPEQEPGLSPLGIYLQARSGGASRYFRGGARPW